MPRKRKIGPISKRVRDLCRDRLNYVIDDSQFKQGLLGILAETTPGNVGRALASWDPNYLYLLTNNVDREIAGWVQLEESDWAIAMRWGRGELKKNAEIERMLVACLQSPSNKAVFEQQLKGWIHKHPDSKKCLREELVGALLDFFFTLADQVNPRIRRDFGKWLEKMSV